MRSKFLALALVLALLGVALLQVGLVVEDRQANRMAAHRSVAQSLAGEQTLLGPLLHMACTEEWETVVDKQPRTEQRSFAVQLPPARLAVSGSTELEARSRGLHATQVFALKARLAASWPDAAALKPTPSRAGSRLACQPPALMLSASDARGIRSATLRLNGQPLELLPGTLHGSYRRGIHALLPADWNPAAPLQVQLDLELLGTQQLSMVPLGSSTEFSLGSNWPHPSFVGQFLPAERRVGDNGFEATWRVSSLASSAQQNVLNGRPLCGNAAAGFAGAADMGDAPRESIRDCTEAFGVVFIDPGDTYALSDRATKYGFLFIGLTFVAVALFEFMKSLRVHPVQYFLVGMALCLFFLLLVSLSEHLPFGQAYAIAAGACVLLLAYYAGHILQGWRRGVPFGAGIALLYGLLYLLLQLEQTALAVGSVALFAVLAAVMALTRKVDWYAQFQAMGRPAARTPPAQNAIVSEAS